MIVTSAARALVVFARSVLALVLLAVGVPVALVWAARRRFGGATPWHGVQWDPGRLGRALGDRLTEQTITDIVIRIALATAWIALAVFLVTVVAEAIHMVRHAGLHLPDVRGLGISQRAARALAAGLLVVLPLVTSPSRAAARSDVVLTPFPRAAATVPAAAASPGGGEAAAGVRAVPLPARSSSASVAMTPGSGSIASAPAVAGHDYVVRPGDSIYGIAAQVVGSDAGAVADYAERIVDANDGRDMGDGRRFHNAAFIDVGWVLALPPVAIGAAGSSSASSSATAGVHVVRPGETLWSIAHGELGDGARWSEVYDANAGRQFADGGVLRDPDVIQAGWDLLLPAASVAPPGTPSPEPPVPAPVPQGDPAPIDVGGDQHDARHWDPPATAERPAASLPDVVWVERDDLLDVAPAPSGGDAGAAAAGVAPESADDGFGAPTLLTMRDAAMLSGGVLTLLAARRRRQLRQAAPGSALPAPAPGAEMVERALRAIDGSGRAARVDIAVRAAALALIEHGRRVRHVACDADGEVELVADGDAVLPAPWRGARDRWWLPAGVPIEALAADARRVAAPCPALVQLGVDESGRDVFVDLEAVEALEIGGSAAQADAIVSAIAVTLAGSALAELTPLVAVDIADAAFLGHRHHVTAVGPDDAFDAARRLIGSTAAARVPTFELRARGTSGEAWEPAVILLGSGVEVVRPPRDRTGLAIVSAAPIEGPSSRLAPEAGAWVLRPAGVRLHPIGLAPADLGALSALIRGADALPTTDHEDPMTPHASTDGPAPAVLDLGRDATVHTFDADDIVDADDIATAPSSRSARRPEVAPVPPLDDWSLLVRLLGPVDVVDRAGTQVEFGRTKTLELVAWLSTHRERSTRTGARTALWEHDVRDATFSNAVSEARRSLAGGAAPPDGAEWIERTMTDTLPLHRAIATDVDVLEQALRASRSLAPDGAIATLAPAVALIRGVPFEATSYLWPDAEGLTSNLILLCTTATAELAVHCLAAGDVEGVFRATGRGLQVLPGHEELISLRMRAHARVGDLAGVRSEWATYERMIDTDPWSDGEPSPKLVELRMQLLHPSR